jgi:hypothetical protein
MRGQPGAWRRMLAPLLFTVACVAVLVGTSVAATGATLPTLTLQQSGHWTLNKALGAVFHVDGGTQQVDARVTVPAAAAQAGTVTLQGETQGYVVGPQRAWPFDKSTLTVDDPVALPAANETPIGIEVVGGPYLVYHAKGTIVRLGRPPVVVDAGGPVGMPVRTTDGTIWVHRADTGALCALRREATAIDCHLGVAPGSRGGLTVTTDRATFVDTAADVARQVRDTALSTGSGLNTDLPADVLLADQDTSSRLPVVIPGTNVLRLLDATGIPDDRVAGDLIDITLGPGTFSSPVVSGEIVAVIELTTSRLFTFSAAGRKVSEVQLAPGTTAESLVRGEDGRIYVDEPGGGETRVVRPDGTVSTISLGGGNGPAVAAAPPTEQLQSVVPPPPGKVVVSVPDTRALPQPRPNPPASGPTPPGNIGNGPTIPPPPPGGPNPVPPPGPTTTATPPPPLAPGAPVSVSATSGGPGSVTVTWQPGGGGAPTEYTVTGSGGVGKNGGVATTMTFIGLAPGTYTFTVIATNAAGQSPVSAASNPVAVAASGPGVPQNLTAQRSNQSGALYVSVNWAAPATGGAVSSYEVTVSGKVYSGVKTVQTTSFLDGTDPGPVTNYCSPIVTYSVRAVDNAGVKGQPATVTVNDPVDCTPDSTVTSAVANADGSVFVRVNCDVSGRGPQVASQIVLLFNGVVKDNGNQHCLPPNTGPGHPMIIYTITGLAPRTTYAVTSRTTSPTGDKTSAAVSVTTP